MVFQKGNTEWKKTVFTPELRKRHSDSKLGEKNPAWKGGVSQDYYRTFLKEKCNRCSNKATVVHHIDENRRNNEVVNLESLCGSCHELHHKHHSKKNIIKKNNKKL